MRSAHRHCLPGLLMLLTLLIAAPTAFAQDGEATNAVSTYGWLSGMDGTVGIGDVDIPVDFSVSDAWDALSSLDSFFILHYEHAADPWTLIADYNYMKFTTSSTGLLGTTTLSMKQTIWELAAAHDVRPKDPEQRLQILAGVRSTDLGMSVTLPGGGGVSPDQEWLDIFVGLRTRFALGRRAYGWARGDIGGFGIGDASDLAWNLILGMGTAVSSSWDLSGGWRWLDYDYETGADATRFKYDMELSGPFFAATYNF